MTWKKIFIILTIAFCGIISSDRLFADAAAVHPEHDADLEKRNINPADMIDGDQDTEKTQNPDEDQRDTDMDNETPTTPAPATPPPDTVNPPRKITFGFRTNIDSDLDVLDGGVEIEVGSQEDEDASQWLVVTPEGYEYDGSPDVLQEIFMEANFSLSGSLDDIISQYGEPSNDEITDAGPGFDVRSKRTVFYPDTRRRVYNPISNYPYSAMGKIAVGCTGTFIGPRHILTAGHCVFDRTTRLWERNLNFQRGKDCDPHFGSYYVWTRVVAPLGWTRDGLSAYNYGMIVVNRVSPTYMSFGWNSLLYRFIINIAGYPADKVYPGRNCLWRTSCTTQQHFLDFFGYRCDTSGMAGSSMYAYFASTNRRIVYCVHAFVGSTYNQCVRITRTKFQGLQRWIRDY